MGHEPHLTVVLPAYNEGAVLGESLERLECHLAARGEAWELVVVDDGSTDATPDLVRRAGAAGAPVRLLSHDRNRGKGAAIATGVAAARGAILAVTDADLSYSLEDLDRAVDAVAAGADVAAGTRTHPDSRIALPFGLFPYLVRRWATGWLFRTVIRLLFGLDGTDTQCGLKAFRRGSAGTIFGRLLTSGFLADVEIFLAAREQGLTLVQTPVHLSYLSGASTVRLAGDLPGAVADLMRIRTALVRGHYGGRPGEPT